MFEILFFIVVCFIKFVLFLIGLAIAIPILFILSAVVFMITGFIIFLVCSFLDRHTNLMEKFFVKFEKWILAADKWTEQFQKKPKESSDDSADKEE